MVLVALAFEGVFAHPPAIEVSFYFVVNHRGPTTTAILLLRQCHSISYPFSRAIAVSLSFNSIEPPWIHDDRDPAVAVALSASVLSPIPRLASRLCGAMPPHTYVLSVGFLGYFTSQVCLESRLSVLFHRTRTSRESAFWVIPQHTYV